MEIESYTFPPIHYDPEMVFIGLIRLFSNKKLASSKLNN